MKSNMSYNYYKYYYACLLLLFISPTTQAQEDCTPSGTLISTDPPPGQCDPTGAPCCKAGQTYETYTCSPQVTTQTNAILTVNSFESGGDGGGASACDGEFYSDDTPVVALSTGWFSGRSRCGRQIVISANALSVLATVVDECDSGVGCDEEHDYQLPCRENVVDGSKAVWSALGISEGDPSFGEIVVTWSDA